MDQHGVDYSRITLIRFSSIRMTTVFQMVLLLRSPEGMQHTTRLHLTVMTCPTIMSFITFRFMPLIPSCKLIIIHPLFGLSTWIAVVASYIYMITLYNLCRTVWVPCKYSCHTILASKATSLLGFIAWHSDSVIVCLAWIWAMWCREWVILTGGGHFFLSSDTVHWSNQCSC